MFDSLRPQRFAAPGARDGADLAARHAHGYDAGSGQVAADAPITHTDPDAGGQVEQLAGSLAVQTNPQPNDQLRPIPGVETRQQYGGLRVSGRHELLRESPAFMGGHLELVGRRVAVTVEPTLQLTPDPTPGLPSLRVPPVNDPLGRVCANLASQAARK